MVGAEAGSESCRPPICRENSWVIPDEVLTLKLTLQLNNLWGSHRKLFAASCNLMSYPASNWTF